MYEDSVLFNALLDVKEEEEEVVVLMVVDLIVLVGGR
jgi:hypothetical protein